MKHSTLFSICALALSLTACSGGKDDETGSPAAGTPPGSPATGTGTGATGTGTGTGATGTGTGTVATGTGTGTATGAVRALITGCDPTFCSFAAGGGPSGGDLCSCVIDGPDHPTANFVEASCWGGAFAPIGSDLTFAFDLNTLGYEGYAIDTCVGYADDSSVAVYDADPVLGGNEDFCQEDSVQAFCNRVTDPGDPSTAPFPTARPASGEAWIVIDEWDDTQIWNGATPRQIDFEFFVVMPVCGNNAVEPGEECDDGGVALGDGCDDRCQREPVCGDGFVDAPELCDDGNLIDGDGCDATCQPEPMQIEDCDPAFCVFTAAGGPNGGDLCECTIPAADHPLLDSLDSVCGGYGGTDVVFGFDKAAYAAVSADVCPGLGGDSVLVMYGDDPRAGAQADFCNDDTATGLCSQVWPAQNAGDPADLTNMPAGGGRVYFQVDEFGGGDFWDGLTDRVVRFELSPYPATVCGDGVAEQFEQCDDGNLVDGDGCSALCEPEPLHIQDCDPTWCVMAPGGGPNGGDLCTCTIPGANHPQLDDLDPTCGFGFGAEATLSFDTTTYQAISGSTCDGVVGGGTYYGYYLETATLSLFGDDPFTGAVEGACSDEAIGEGNGCVKLWDPQIGGDPAQLVNVPPGGGGRVYLVVDDAFGYWWDGAADRVITVELSPYPATVCGDGVAELTETCDDGNLVDGDGCSATCRLEPFVVTGCDPTWCTFTYGSGPNGGDVCECTFTGVDHPTTDLVPDANCFGGGSGKELLMHFDTTGYTQYSVDTCALAPGYPTLSDSSVATFSADPLGGGGLQLGCNDDANGHYDWCSKVSDTALNQPAGPAPAAATNQLWVQIDEYDPTGGYSYWDGASTRTFLIELIP